MVPLLESCFIRLVSQCGAHAPYQAAISGLFNFLQGLLLAVTQLLKLTHKKGRLLETAA